MNVNDIKELAEIMQSTGLSMVEIEEEGLKLRLEKNIVVAAIPQEIPAGNPHITSAPVSELKAAEGKVIKSPTVGVYYSSPSPESPPYVSVGSKVKVGDVLCIIEAMKLMNEITADTDGEITEVCSGNGQVVEFGQPLFRLK